MSSITLGIDVAKDKFDIAVYHDGQYQTATFANDEDGYRSLLKWLKKRRIREAAACLEATGTYGQALALTLYEHKFAVSMVNPARIKAYGASQLKRNKTDLEDAKVIAHFCATQDLELWEPPSAEIQELQALARRLAVLKEDRTRELNRRQAGVRSETVLQGIAEHVAFLEAQIETLEQRISQFIDQNPDLRRQRDLLTSIPGIGEITATLFLAEVPDITRFSSAAQLAAYAGLTPRRRQSGSRVHGPAHLSKTGNSHLRAAFFMPALIAKRHNPVIEAFVLRLEARGKRPMVIVGAVMRKLLHLAFGVLKTGKPFNPNHLSDLQIPA